MGLPPTLASTIRDLKAADRCYIRTTTGGTIAGPGLVNFAGHELERLSAECEALRKDAERYRWLRAGRLLRQGHDTGAGQRKIDRDPLRAVMSFAYWCSEEQLDAAIDAEANLT